MNDLIIIWRILDLCNLGCRFCEFSVSNKYPRVTIQEAQIIRFTKLLYEYKENNQSEILISWLGGEPFLWKEIFKVSKYLKLNYRFHISTTTNGTFLSNKQVRNDILNVFDELTVSIDGIGNVHDTLRNKRGLYNGVLGNLRKLKEEKELIGADLRIRVNTVLHRENINSILDLCATLANSGVNNLSFNPLMCDKNSQLYKEYGLRPEDIGLLRKLDHDRKLIHDRYGIIVSGDQDYFTRIENYIRDIRVPVNDCKPGANILFINQFGNIGPCSFIANQTEVNISALDTLDDIGKLSSHFRNIILAKRPRACLDCYDTNVFGKFNDPDSISVDKAF